jgi:predicted ribosomally synthesized peptide with SipW-like signal peptide
MNKNKKILIICVSLLVLVLLIGVGATYAYFSAQITGSESSTTITADSGQMTIVYDNGSGVITANNISPDSKPFATKTFTVTGNNTTDKMMPYDLSLVVEENTFYASLSFDLVSVNTSNSGYIIPSREGEGIGYNAETIGLGTGMFGKWHGQSSYLYFKNIL